MITDYHWIDDNSDLEALKLLINPSEAVAFDSEFERVNTFYPRPALFQLYFNQTYYLIDMKKISNNQVFKSLLDNVILHSGSEDLEILYNSNQQLPSKVFDTQVAASLCGFGLHFSYQNIVKELLGVELEKAHSRSDWMRRPLSQDQIQYALDDVVYLNDIKNTLTQKLTDLGRLSWFDLLMKNNLINTINSNFIDKTFIKMAQSKRLDPQQSQLLYAILNWRDKVAIKRDKPRQWILKNDAIINLVLTRPKSTEQLIKDVGLYPKFVKHNADHIFELYDKSKNIDLDSLPYYKKLNAAQTQIFTQQKHLLQKKCDELSIPPAIIINIADLKSLVASGKTLEDIKMWQRVNSA